MLISEQKPFEEILDYVTKDRVIFLIGCKGCADGCESGGERQVLEIKKRLEKEGKAISGFSLIDMVCNEALTRMKLAAYAEAIESADSVLVMTCGAGIQTVASSTHKVIHPGCNTISSGHAEWKQAEGCMECGDCVLEFTGGICPVTACPKGILNGPCGGCENGKCEVNRDMSCAWVRIYERMNKTGRLQELSETTIDAKDWSESVKPGTLIARDKKK